MSDADVIRRFLEHTGMLQRDLADEMKMSESALSNVMHGRALLTRWQVARFGRLFGASWRFAETREEAREK